jgi:hypothetical protein
MAIALTWGEISVLALVLLALPPFGLGMFLGFYDGAITRRSPNGEEINKNNSSNSDDPIFGKWLKFEVN